MRCPVCGSAFSGAGPCPSCGFDRGLWYERYATLSPLREGIGLRARRANWQKTVRDRLLCPECGGLLFTILLGETALRCDVCGCVLGQSRLRELLPAKRAEAAKRENDPPLWKEDPEQLQILSFRKQKVVTGYSGSLPFLKLPEGVTALAGHAFEGRTSLQSVLLPQGLTMLGEAAFSGCRALKTIELPAGVSVLRRRTFANCSALERATLPNGLCSIENEAFSGCGSLRELRVPDSLKTLAESAFRGVHPDFRLVASPGWIRAHAHLPETVGVPCVPDESLPPPRSLPDGPRRTGAAETRRSGTGTEKTDGAGPAAAAGGRTEPVAMWQYDPAGLQILSLRAQKIVTGYSGAVPFLTLPEGITAIAGHAFERCIGLQGILLPAGLGLIGEAAFSGCSELRKIELPAGITVLRSRIFAGCAKLEKAALPEGLCRIEDDAFSGCGSLRELRVPDSLALFSENAFRGTRADFRLIASVHWIQAHIRELEQAGVAFAER